jgi:hypothetical protein
MSPLPTFDWQSSLDEIAKAVQQALEHLERFETEWAAVLGEKTADRTSLSESSRLEKGVRDWEGRLTAAADLAASVEQELNDRQIEVERWHQSFSRWQEMIQQTAAAPDSPGTDPGPTG